MGHGDIQSCLLTELYTTVQYFHCTCINFVREQNGKNYYYFVCICFVSFWRFGRASANHKTSTGHKFESLCMDGQFVVRREGRTKDTASSLRAYQEEGQTNGATNKRSKHSLTTSSFASVP